MISPQRHRDTEKSIMKIVYADACGELIEFECLRALEAIPDLRTCDQNIKSLCLGASVAH